MLLDIYLEALEFTGLEIEIKEKTKLGKVKVREMGYYCCYGEDDFCQDCKDAMAGQYLRIVKLKTPDVIKYLEEVIDHYYGAIAKIKVLKYKQGLRPPQKRGRKYRAYDTI